MEQQVRTSFTHRVGRKVREVQYSEVVAFEASNKYVDAFLEDGSTILLSQDQCTIKALAIEFPEFQQVNRGILVRRASIQEIKRDVARCKYDVVLKDFTFPVSRRFAPIVRKALKNESTSTSQSVCSGVAVHVPE